MEPELPAMYPAASCCILLQLLSEENWTVGEVTCHQQGPAHSDWVARVHEQGSVVSVVLKIAGLVVAFRK